MRYFFHGFCGAFAAVMIGLWLGWGRGGGEITADAPQEAHSPGERLTNSTVLQAVAATLPNQSQGTNGIVAVGDAGKPEGDRHSNAGELTTDASREAWSAEKQKEASREQAEARVIAEKAGRAPRGEVGDGTYEFAAVRNGRVYVRTTRNENAAISAAVVPVRAPSAPGLTGSNLTVGVWDAGSVRATHQEFAGRLTLRNTVAANTHSTHVGGTIAAAGISANAKGMAPGVKLHSYDWNFDIAEMISAGRTGPQDTTKLPVSNHSYGFQAGWYGNSGSGFTWYGTWGLPESDGFGLYESFAAELDGLCYSLPHYLPFKAAGNDRNDLSPSVGQTFTYFTDGGSVTKPYDPLTDPPADGWDGGYDTIALEGTAKNILTVGAVNDAVSGGERSLAQATMTSFSSWGPTDDGRVKPDLVANGSSLFSTMSLGDVSYGTSSGTSMASPSAMGAATLVISHFENLFPGRAMRASTMKGLLIHTADDLGTAGPDYIFGWGLINARLAVEHITAHHASTNAWRLAEVVLPNASTTNRFPVYWDRQADALKITVCWTDPPGPERATLDDRTPVLMHDLDLRVVGPTGDVTRAFVLDVNAPASPATTGDNHVDNVEQVIIPDPAVGPYSVEVSAKGVLASPQHYSVIVSGTALPPLITHVPLANTTNSTSPYSVYAEIDSEAGLDTNTLAVYWSTEGLSGPYSMSPLDSAPSGGYEGIIPAQPVGSTIHYYLEAMSTNGLAGRQPVSAPEVVHHFSIVQSFTLFVGGVPIKVPGVSPPYGYTAFPSGVLVQATAPLYGEASGGVRQQCVGWTACCGLPASGTTNTFNFVIKDDAFLSWQWAPAYALEQSATVVGGVSGTTWWVTGSTGATLLASDEAGDGGSYRFVSWYVDGTRWPDATNRAQNPAVGILMTTPRTAVAEYLSPDVDADGNGVKDWWEVYYFGSTGMVFNLDSDGDGYSNIKEYQDGTDPQNPAEVPEPPSIAHTPLASPQGRPAPWTVWAGVSDNHELASVALEWQRLDEPVSWFTVVAELDPTNGLYKVDIPAPAVTGDALTYRLAAVDGAGLRAVNGPYTVQVAYPVAEPTPTALGTVALPTNSNQRLPLEIENFGHAPLSWSLLADSAGLDDDVEQGAAGWTSGGTPALWHVAGWRAYSGSNAWYMGLDSNRQYPDSCASWLLSPPVHLEPGAKFSFQHWLHTEPPKDAVYAWDGGVVELSTDDGATFTQITPAGGYPYLIYGHPASGFPDGTPCFAGTGGWGQVTFDLSAFTGQTVRVRLRFGADGFVVGEGWFVDDLRFEPYTGPADWLSLSKTNGHVNVGTSPDALLVTVDSTPLAPAEQRRAFLRLESNDPIHPRLLIPVAIHNTTRRIDVDIDGEGTVAPSGPVFLPLGASTNFVVTAAPYHTLQSLFTNGVPVAVAGGQVATNLIWSTLGLPGNGVLRAEFAPNLTDSGVAEWWLVQYGLTNAPLDDEALADQDADGLITRDEYLSGTDPTDATSRLAFAEMEAVEIAFDEDVIFVEAHTLRWGSVSGRFYTVSMATNLAGAYSVLWTDLPATPPENTVTTAVSPVAAGYYRLDVTWPESP